VLDAKDTARALVRIGYDGTVHKQFRAAKAKDRFENEIRVLRYLERRGCDFVPRVLEANAEQLELVTTNCGARVDHIGDEKLQSLFAELETFGVRHDDPYMRNITYRASDGRFCIIDFEFATILEPDAEAEADALLTTDAAPASRLQLQWSGLTDRGWLRTNNEDAFLTLAFNREDFVYLGRNGECPTEDFDFVFAVSDGMGGEHSGEFASRCAIDNITSLLPRRFRMSADHSSSVLYDCLYDLFQGIHWQLTTLSEAYGDGHSMGATLSLVWYVAGRWYVGHIGDSRVYHLPRGGRMKQVSEDHTHVGWLRRAGKLNEREARNHPRRNVLSQSLGAGNQIIRPQLSVVDVAPGDKLLLCTDGVTEALWDRAIEELLEAPDDATGGHQEAERLVRTAVAESGRDNATAIVIDIGA